MERTLHEQGGFVGERAVEEDVSKTDRYCFVCKRITPLASLKSHSIGLLHAICAICGFCQDCDEGNV